MTRTRRPSQNGDVTAARDLRAAARGRIVATACDPPPAGRHGATATLTGISELPTIDHDELSPGERRLARIVLGPFHEWNPDIALRYLPIVRLIEREGLASRVTDVGSGSTGIAPYLKRRVTGVDTDFAEPVHPLLDPVRSSVLETPFEDASRPCVISVDMLEHLPEDLRQRAVDELVRIAGQLLVLAVPAGAEAQRHDAEMAELFRAVRGAEFRYLREHVENGLPSPAGLEAYVRKAMERHGRQGRLDLVPNANLKLRSFIARRWIHRGVLDKGAWVALTWLSPALSRLNGGVTYRQLAVVRFAR